MNGRQRITVRHLKPGRWNCQERLDVRGRAPERCLNRAVYKITLVNLPDRDQKVRVCHKHLAIYLRLRDMVYDIPYHKGKGLL